MGVHDNQVQHLYRLRMVGMIIALLLIAAGISAMFLGLEGSFDWAIEAPSGVAGKITNASPGILLALFGFFLAWRIIEQPAVDVQIGPMGSKSGSNRR